MKKLIICAAALATALFAGSCQQELLETTAGENTVTYTVAIPSALTKASAEDHVARIGDGSNVDQLIYEVWKTGEADQTDLYNDAVCLYQEETSLIKGENGERKAVITLNLVQDQEYTILFWAQVRGTGNYTTSDLRNVRYAKNIRSEYNSNVEDYAAFYAVDFVSDSDPKSKKVSLTRPFAQLNLGTLNTADKYTVAMVESEVSVKGVPTGFNVAEKKALGEGNVKFNYYAVPQYPDSEVEVSGKLYQYAAMNYIFADNQKRTTTVTYNIKTKVTSGAGVNNEVVTENVVVNNTIDYVPLQENYRTNIVGNLLTSTTQYEVVVDADFNTKHHLVNAWNGSEVIEPKTNDNGDYLIETPSELAWLAVAVNGTLPENTRANTVPNDFSGETFILTKDIDLNNLLWTPIGNGNNPFKGIFDGGEHTIYNLFVDGGSESNKGLFGYTTDGEIKNLTVENAKVSGRLNVGVVAGQPYTSKYTNITVKGHIEVNGMAYVGGVGGKNAYADWTNITVEADKTSYVKANSVENGTAYRTYVGGVCGFNGEGGHAFKDITSNINVQGSTCDVGGLFGIAHYNNKFENCVCSGDVEIYAASESGDAEEIGGIAGVWHNENGTQVTFDDCLFTGELTVNVKGVDLTDNTITGAPYSATGTGKLIIDGKALYMVSEVPAEIDLAEGNTVIIPDLSADHKIVVKGKGTVVLNGTTIETAAGPAIEFAEDANVTITVNGEVALTGATDGILVNGATLTVTGTGNLVVEGKAGSGIDGSVTIDGLAHITSKGNGDHAYGIGGIGANVVIMNSIVDYACGGHIQSIFINDTKYGKSEPEGGAAIGGATVKIEGSTITKVDGGSKAAAIGERFWQSTSIEIVNSTIKEANGGNASAGIGGSRYNGDDKYNVSIKIQNSTVTATGGQHGAGIGSGYDTHCNGQDYTAENKIEIDEKSEINAKGGKYAAGIGTGFHSAYLTGSIAAGANINAESGEASYKDSYTTAQNIGYGVVDPAREFSKDNRNITFKVAGKLIESPYKWPVAKVGNTEYTSIDEAIAAWTNGSTLTLLANVTLSDVVTLNSTEHHILDLGTYTMTAAEGKNAFVIKACGTGDAERTAITIKADAKSPGGINAGKQCIIYYKYADGGISGNDRPIIKIEGGVFTGPTSSFGTAGIYTIGTAARKCATLNISGGVFNCSINGSGKSKLLISGGIFHYSVGSQGDSTALRLISGGTFKTLGFMTADSNNTKFWFGTSMANSNVGLYINDDNYLVVGGPVITEFGDKFAAKATNPTKWSSYLAYSSAATNGLYYTNAEMAIEKHDEANVVLK